MLQKMLHFIFCNIIMKKNERNAMEKLELSNLLQGETLTIEYKDDSKRDFNDDLIIKACVSMSNANGGVVLIGVSDIGEIVGSLRAKKGSPQALEGMIRERTNPGINTTVSFINHENKTVVIIQVPKSIDVISTSGGLYLKRQLDSHGKPENKPMSLDEILRGVTRFGMTDLSAGILAEITLDDIDMELVLSTAQKILSSTSSEADKEIFGGTPLNILKSIGLLDRNNIPNIAAILLFGKEDVIKERIPNHFVQYQVFSNSGEILKNEKYYLPIVKLFPILLQSPELCRNSNELVINGQSIVIPEYSKDGLREAFANALVHRDYTMHSGIQVQVYPDELKISSAGGFLDGINIHNLLSVPPTPRNRRLSEAMMRLKFVETSGRGIDIIFYSQARFGRPAPDYSETTPSTVIARLIGGTANLEFCRYIMSLGKPSLSEMLILNSLFYKRSINISDAAILLQTSETVAQQILTELLKKEWLEIIDEKNPIYLLKGTLKKNKIRLNEKMQSQIKDKILKILLEHPNLNRTEMSDILNLSPDQTYRLLSSLQKENKIILDGKSWRLKNQ